MNFPGDVEVADLSVLDEAERADLVSLIQRSERGETGASVTTAGDVGVFLDGPDAELWAGRLLRREGRLIGAQFVECYSEARDVLLDPHVETTIPEDRRRAILDALLQDGLASARVIAARYEDSSSRPERHDPHPALVNADPHWDTNPEIWQVTASSLAGEHERNDAYSRAGFRHVRTFAQMRIDVAATTLAPPAPRGVTSRVVCGDSDLRAVHAIYNEAFADHWGEYPRAYESWLANHRARPGHDEGQWVLAIVDGQSAGICLCDDSKVPHGYGHVEILGVLRSARGRGVADYLLRSAFAASAARGLQGTELEVDSSSPTGADRLYYKVGMRP
ncbi:MAG: GNAT family N-acetyltransferase, partial [Candidatus Nanopelagicales bacterium]|nr:GNAT family N-acetyltransferase [Candidatus Nanopelagicales bacterium]